MFGLPKHLVLLPSSEQVVVSSDDEMKAFQGLSAPPAPVACSMETLPHETKELPSVYAETKIRAEAGARGRAASGEARPLSFAARHRFLIGPPVETGATREGTYLLEGDLTAHLEIFWTISRRREGHFAVSRHSTDEYRNRDRSDVNHGDNQPVWHL